MRFFYRNMKTQSRPGVTAYFSPPASRPAPSLSGLLSLREDLSRNWLMVFVPIFLPLFWGSGFYFLNPLLAFLTQVSRRFSFVLMAPLHRHLPSPADQMDSFQLQWSWTKGNSKFLLKPPNEVRMPEWFKAAIMITDK